MRLPAQVAAAFCRAASGPAAMPIQAGSQLPALQMRPGRQSLPHAPQFCSSAARSTQLPPQAVSAPQPLMHVPPLHTSMAPQSPSVQHSAQATMAQHINALEAQASFWQALPPPMQLSTVQPTPSEHCASPQHTLQAPPQSLGVAARQLQLPPLQAAPGLLHGVLHAPQCAALDERASSQPSPGCRLQSP
jgi:hypothetical protein